MSESLVRAPTGEETPATSGWRGAAGRLGAIDEIGVIGALVALCVFLAFASDKFLTSGS